MKVSEINLPSTISPRLLPTGIILEQNSPYRREGGTPVSPVNDTVFLWFCTIPGTPGRTS